MNNVFFIGDTHFGHRNIIGYNRPEFDSLEEMHEVMIDKWNEVVKPNDTVYHLGDVAFGKAWIPATLPQLNGRKRLILGNHDYPNMDLYKLDFVKIYGVAYFDKCVLTHIPIHPCQEGRFKLNIHGHVHHIDPNIHQDNFYYNVNADHINYTPVAWETIKLERGL